MNQRGKLTSDPSAESEVRAVIERFRSGWERLDAAQVLSTLARRDDTVMFGTDLSERWIGYDAVVGPTQAMVSVFEHPIYRWGPAEPCVWVRGDVGWACGDLTVDFAIAKEQRHVVMRSSFVVVREDDGWKIAHAHFSVGQEEPVADYPEP